MTYTQVTIDIPTGPQGGLGEGPGALKPKHKTLLYNMTYTQVTIAIPKGAQVPPKGPLAQGPNPRHKTPPRQDELLYIILAKAAPPLAALRAANIFNTYSAGASLIGGSQSNRREPI